MVYDEYEFAKDEPTFSRATWWQRVVMRRLARLFGRDVSVPGKRMFALGRKVYVLLALLTVALSTYQPIGKL